MSLTLSHFSAAIIFAFFASLVFAITQKNTKPEIIRFLIKHFFALLGLTILAGWLMAALRYFAIKP
jgi:hypothetical protein